MGRIFLSRHEADRAVSHRIVETHFGIQRYAIKSAKRREGKTDGAEPAEPKATEGIRPSVVPKPRHEPQGSWWGSTALPDRKPSPARTRPEPGSTPSAFRNSRRRAAPPARGTPWRRWSAPPATRRGRAGAPGSGDVWNARENHTPLRSRYNSPTGWSGRPKRRPTGRLARIAPERICLAIRPLSSSDGVQTRCRRLDLRDRILLKSAASRSFPGIGYGRTADYPPRIAIMKPDPEYRPHYLIEGRWELWLPWCLSLVNLVLLVRLLANSSTLVSPLLVTLATSLLAVSIIPVLRMWIERSVRRNLERELGSTFTLGLMGESSKLNYPGLHNYATKQMILRLQSTMEGVIRDDGPQLIPSQENLWSLGPPTLTVEGVSLSQLLQEQREERL